MSKKAPGKAHREGISIMKLTEMFPDEASAIKWFEDTRWPGGERHCGHCGSTETKEVPNAKPMPYWCKSCRSYFSVRTGTSLQNSRLPLRKWVFAVYLYVTSLKGISSMKLHRDIKVTQKTAWYMLHRLRDAWDEASLEPLTGSIEVDETYMGGKMKNMHGDKCREAREKPDYGKTIVAGAKDRATGAVRARTVDAADKDALSAFIGSHAAPGAAIYTDEAKAYTGVPNRESVNHSAGEYVIDDGVSTNGIESFWSMLKRGHASTYH